MITIIIIIIIKNSVQSKISSTVCALNTFSRTSGILYTLNSNQMSHVLSRHSDSVTPGYTSNQQHVMFFLSAKHKDKTC